MKKRPRGHSGNATGDRGRKMPGGTATKKVIVEFPDDLLERTDLAASEASTNRSAFLRSAVESYLENARRAKLERELAAGYQANAERDLKIAAEFAYVDGEDL